MSTAALKIKIFDSKGTQTVPIAKSTATVGSAAHCDLVLNHDSVQAEHIRVWVEGGRVWVQDLGGSTGTTLNGIRLPHLKPMLVRELDMIKLGECSATLGLELNMVRAPIVKPAPTITDDVTLTDIKPLKPVQAALPPIPVGAPTPLAPTPEPSDMRLEHKRDELAKVSRELADMKLQLQMARLDRDTGEEMLRQIATLQDDVARAGNDQSRMSELQEQIDREKRAYKKQFDDEVAALKLRALKDLKEHRDADQNNFEEWKREAFEILCARIRHVLTSKSKNARTYSREAILAWEPDFEHAARRVLLRSKAEETGSSATGTKAKERRQFKRRGGGETLWNRIALVSFGLAIFLSALWVLSSYLKQGSQPRSVAGRASASVEVIQPGPYMVAQSKDFKKTYTDNVLATTHYVDAELNNDFRGMWLKELTRVARSDWKIGEQALSSITSQEVVLIQDLNRLREDIAPERPEEGIAQMRAREAKFVTALKTHLGKRATVEKFMRLKRGFYTRNQVYLVREKR